MKNSLFTLFAMICLGAGGLFFGGCGLEKDPVSLEDPNEPIPNDTLEVSKGDDTTETIDTTETVDTTNHQGSPCGVEDSSGYGYKPCVDGENSKKVKGDWGIHIDLGEMVNLAVFVELDEVTGKHVLYATEPTDSSNDTVFVHKGVWSLDADSVYLHGEQCQKVDRAPDPDTLVAYECGKSIPIQINKRGDDFWYIKVKDFIQIADAVEIEFPKGTHEIEVVFNRDE